MGKRPRARAALCACVVTFWGLGGDPPLLCEEGRSPVLPPVPTPEEPADHLGPYPEPESGLNISKYLKLDGQLRFRYEYSDPFSYTADGVDQEDDAVLMRTRLGFLITPHPKIGVRVQIQDSRIWGEEAADVDPPSSQNPSTGANPSGSVTTSADNLDLHEAYLDLKDLFSTQLGKNTLALRIGRQELSFGDQRLVSPLDWSNIARAWDAARLRIRPAEVPGGFQVDLFASIIRDTASSEVGGGPVGVRDLDTNQMFHGLYVSFDDIRPASRWGWVDDVGVFHPFLGPHEVDGYVFYRDLTDDVFTAENGVVGNVHDVTLGLRGAGEFLRNAHGSGFDYSAEFAYQTGKFSDDDVRAFGFAVAGGYTLAGKSLNGTKVRFGIEYDYGSGDSDPTDGRRETFDPLFPFAHKYQGIQDTFSWKNGQDLAFSIEARPPEEIRIRSVELAYHLFWLTEKEDAWYNAGLLPIRRDLTGSSGRFVGSEIDLLLRYDLLSPFANLWFGYSHFFPGTFVRNTGSDPGRDFVFAQLQVDF